ncbi:hypothetical protein [Burkholderia gladioli]|uniref:hypothetical protein n=1 Tax=Burkholderia gladioli TaxID=28095 RepID=UPI00187D5B54|nr:hypothetical protein [Burkholderia gladioli]
MPHANCRFCFASRIKIFLPSIGVRVVESEKPRNDLSLKKKGVSAFRTFAPHCLQREIIGFSSGEVRSIIGADFSHH